MSERDIRHLVEKKTTLEGQIEKAKGVYASLGSSVWKDHLRLEGRAPGVEKQRIAVTVASVKAAIRDNAVVTLQSQHAEVAHQLESVTNYSTLVSDLEETEKNIPALKHAVSAGLLPQSELTEAESYLKSLRANLDSDEMRNARDIYDSSTSPAPEKASAPAEKPKKRQSNPKAVKPKPKLTEGDSGARRDMQETVTFNRQEMTISHGEKRAKLGGPEMAVFGHLSDHAGKWVSASRLQKDLKNVGSESEAFRVVYRLRKKLEQIGFDESAIETKRNKVAGRYRLKIGLAEQVAEENLTGLICAVDMEERTIRIGRRVSVLTSDELEVFLAIAGSEGMRIRSTDLSSALEKTSVEKKQQSTIVARIQKKIEPNAAKPRLLVATGAKSGSRYELRGLRVEINAKPEDANGEAEVRREAAPALLERHLVGLNYVVGNPDGDMNVVIEAMGLTKADKPFTRAQTMMAIKRSSSSAFARVRLGIANDQEVEIVGKIEEFVQDSGDDAKTRFKEVISNFFTKDRKSVQEIIDEPVEEQENVVLPTEEEVSIVVTLLRNRKDLIKKYKLPTIPKELLEEYSSPTFRRSVERRTEEQLMELRKSACDKFAALIRSDQLYELIDTMSGRATMLAEYFIDLDRTDQLKALEELLMEHQNGVKYAGDKFGVVGDKRDDEIRDERLARILPSELSDTTGVLGVAPEDSAAPDGISNDALAQDELIVSVGPITVAPNVAVEAAPKKSDLERRFPDVEDRVKKIIDRVIETQLQHFNVPQMARVLNLKTKFLEDHADIKPGAGGDGKPLYGIVAAVQLLAVKEFGNNLPQRLYRELQGYVRSQVHASLANL